MDTTTTPQRGSSLTIGKKMCAVFIPMIRVVETVALRLVGCFDDHSPRPVLRYTLDDLCCIASTSIFTVNEVEALLELFKKLSSTIVDDGFLHKISVMISMRVTSVETISTTEGSELPNFVYCLKEELQLALLRAPGSENLFLDRVFDLFDEKKNGVIAFEEFVHALSVFHPSASLEDKIEFAFRLYDLRQTGYIEREEVQQMLNAILLQSGIQLTPQTLDNIIEKTFADADINRDGKIDKDEWKAYVVQHPALLKNMTLPYLKDITTVFPSFIFNTEVDD